MTLESKRLVVIVNETDDEERLFKLFVTTDDTLLVTNLDVTLPCGRRVEWDADKIDEVLADFSPEHIVYHDPSQMHAAEYYALFETANKLAIKGWPQDGRPHEVFISHLRPTAFTDTEGVKRLGVCNVSVTAAGTDIVWADQV